MRNILIEILVEKKKLEAFLYVKFFHNFLIKAVEGIFKNSCFSNSANMLEWQLKS